MVNARELSRQVSALLRTGGITAPLETAVVLEAGTGLSREDVLRGEQVEDERAAQTMRLAQRRLQGEPLQYLAGRWPFLSEEYEVGPGVLIPRPETEGLALRAAAFLAPRRDALHLDLCAGSGCIAIAVGLRAAPAHSVAVELSREAADYCRRNARRLYPGLVVEQADVFGFEATLPDASVDLITCNPPYVTEEEYQSNRQELIFEPKQALVAPGDALGFYRDIPSRYRRALKPDGAILFECGSTQTGRVAALLARGGYREIQEISDDFGLPRYVMALAGNGPQPL